MIGLPTQGRIHHLAVGSSQPYSSDCSRLPFIDLPLSLLPPAKRLSGLPTKAHHFEPASAFAWFGNPKVGLRTVIIPLRKSKHLFQLLLGKEYLPISWGSLALQEE